MIQTVIWLLLPVGAAFLITAGQLTGKRFGRFLNPLVYAAGICIGISLLLLKQNHVIILGGWKPPFGINLYLSPLSLGAGIMIYFIAFLISIYDLDKKRAANYNLLFNLFIFSSLGMILTSDFFNLFVMMEIGSIAMIGLVGAAHLKAGARAAIKYLLPASLFSMIFLAAVALLYSSLGTLNIADIIGKNALNTSFAVLIASGLLGALILEAELFPLNSWVPDVYRGASSSFSAGLSGISALVGVLVLGRIFLTMMAGTSQGAGSSFQGSFRQVQLILGITGIASILIGEIAALKEKDLKKMLAYSSIGQLGIVAFAMSTGIKEAIFAGLFILFAHSITKPMMFFIAGSFIRITGKARWKEMRGAARNHPFLGGAFIIGAFSLMGIPFFAAFWGKMGLIKILIKGPFLLQAGLVAILIGSILEGIYFMKAGHTLFEKPEQKSNPFKENLFSIAKLIEGIPVFILVAVILIIGFFPQTIESFLQNIVNDLSGSADYAKKIIGEAVKTGAGL